MANSEQVTFASVWSDVQLRATRKIFTDIRAEFGKKFQIRNMVDTQDLGTRLGGTTTTASEQYRGVFIDLDNFDADHEVVSNFQQFNIQTIKIYLLAAVNPIIKIFDALHGTELKSITMTDGAIGWNTVEVYEKFTARRIFVCFDATSVESTYFHIEDDHCGCGARNRGGTAPVQSLIKKSDITRGENGHGLSVQYDVQCTFDSIVCNHKEIFTNALWYLLGAELMMEAQYSDRINFTTIDKKRIKELKKELFDIYTEELDMAVKGVSLAGTDCCLECNDEVIIKEVDL